MKLTDFRNREKDKDVFIFGAGPSLHYFDLDIIKGRPTICVNSSILKIKNPSYYLTSDGHQTMKKHWELVQNGIFPVVCSSQGVSDHMLKYGPIDQSRYCSFQKEKNDTLNSNAEKIIYGYSSMHCALHFAVILGAKRIILIGADCESNGQYKRFYDYPGETEDCCVIPEMEKHIQKASNPETYFTVFVSYYRKLKEVNPDVYIECLGGRLVKENVYPDYEGD